MPYLKDEKLRKILDEAIEDYGSLLMFPGTINYLLFKLAKKSCHKYEQYRNFIGELEASKREIKRRLGKNHWLVKQIEKIIDKIYDELVAPYEDKKIKEHGDVE